MQALKAQTTEDSSGNPFGPIFDLMNQGIDDGVAPGMVLLIAKDGDAVFLESFGARTFKYDRNTPITPISVDSVFDVASLTSVMVTTTLVMKLWESGKVGLDDKAARFLQGFGVFGKSAVSIRQLLNHSSGLAHWAPFYEELVRVNAGSRLGVLTSRGAREYVLNSIIRSHLKYEPGSRQVYSDLGIILLGYLIESLSGLSLDKAAHKYIFQPLGLKSTSFIDLSMIKRRGIHPVTDLIAPTEECPWRKRILCGEVHDDNAWAMGGIAGHSGLFTVAKDIHRFSRELVAAYRGASEFLKRDTVKTFWEASREHSTGWRLGWDSPNFENGMAESGLSDKAIGACGFTGCSLWIEPERGVEIILMTNRINPSRSNKKILNFRPRLHRAVLEILSGY